MRLYRLGAVNQKCDQSTWYPRVEDNDDLPGNQSSIPQSQKREGPTQNLANPY